MTQYHGSCCGVDDGSYHPFPLPADFWSGALNTFAARSAAEPGPRRAAAPRCHHLRRLSHVT